MVKITIAPGFCGPPTSANGGYFVGLVAALADRSVAVRLRKPPPLGVEITVEDRGEGVLELRHAGDLIAQTRPEELTAPTLAPPSYVQAIEASRRYVGFAHHPFPTCFVCGPQRRRGDGLRIFPGALSGRPLVAAPWVPDDSLDAGGGKVRPEFMWAALDCPGWIGALGDTRLALLGELTAHVDRCVHVGEECVVVGWHISSNGRAHLAGTAVFAEDGELCGYGRATWIEPRPAAV
jgi:hypothetical protein